jgi:parvulin-like peptidyl-prolyl isomerase
MNWWREPLVHFFFLGAVVFGVHSWAENRAGEASRRRVVVSEAQRDVLARSWEEKWGRAPDPEELQDLVDGLVREEILAREAIDLGLDREDPVIRSHLASKMEFVALDRAPQQPPSEEELRSWYEEAPLAYQRPPQVSFVHVLFSRERGDRSLDDARALLDRAHSLNLSTEEALANSDPSTLEAIYTRRTQDDLLAIFGAELAGRLFSLELGVWSGPIESPFGFHLVRVFERTEAKVPTFDEARAKVLEDVLNARRKEANAALYREIASKYDVVIEGDATGGSR